MTYQMFRYLYFYKGEPLLFEKARIVDEICDEPKVVYLLELITRDLKKFYGIFGTYVFTLCQTLPLGNKQIPLDHVVIFEDKSKAEYYFNLIKDNEIPLYDVNVRHSRIDILNSLAKEINRTDDIMNFYEHALQEIESAYTFYPSDKAVINRFLIGIKQYIRMLIRLKKIEYNEKLYFLVVQEGSLTVKVSVFAKSLEDAIKQASSRVVKTASETVFKTEKTTIAEAYEIDENLNKIPVQSQVTVNVAQ